MNGLLLLAWAATYCGSLSRAKRHSKNWKYQPSEILGQNKDLLIRSYRNVNEDVQDERTKGRKEQYDQNSGQPRGPDF